MHRHGGFEGEVHGETAKGSENAADKDKTPKKREKNKRSRVAAIGTTVFSRRLCWQALWCSSTIAGSAT